MLGIVSNNNEHGQRHKMVIQAIILCNNVLMVASKKHGRVFRDAADLKIKTRAS